MISLIAVSYPSLNGPSALNSLVAKGSPHTKKPVDRDEATYYADHCRGDAKHLNDVNLMLIEIIVLG